MSICATTIETREDAERFVRKAAESLKTYNEEQFQKAVDRFYQDHKTKPSSKLSDQDILGLFTREDAFIPTPIQCDLAYEELNYDQDALCPFGHNDGIIIRRIKNDGDWPHGEYYYSVECTNIECGCRGPKCSAPWMALQTWDEMTANAS